MNREIHLTIVGKMNPEDLPKSRRQIKAERELQKHEAEIKEAHEQIEERNRQLKRLVVHAERQGWVVRAFQRIERVNNLFEAIFPL